MFMEMLWLTEAPMVTGWEEWQLSNQENKSTMISHVQAILSQLSVLKCCSMLMPLFMRIDASKPTNWHWVFQSEKEALVTSFKILDIPRCVQNEFLTVKHNTESKAIFFCVVGTFWSRWRDLILDCYSRWNLGPLFWTWDKKVNLWNGTILKLPGRKN